MYQSATIACELCSTSRGPCWTRPRERRSCAFQCSGVALPREAGQAVTGASLPLLAGLVNKSFLRHDPSSGRFEIHELLRQYAQEQLEETPEDSIIALEAHADFFAKFMEQRWGHLRDHRQKVALLKIDADLENIRTAWRYRINQANALTDADVRQ